MPQTAVRQMSGITSDVLSTASGATLDFEVCRSDVIEVAAAQDLSAEGEYARRSPEEIHEVVSHVHAQPSHAAGGAFRWVASPATSRRQLFRERHIGLGVDDGAEATTVDQVLQTSGPRLSATVVSDLEYPLRQRRWQPSHVFH